MKRVKPTKRAPITAKLPTARFPGRPKRMKHASAFLEQISKKPPVAPDDAELFDEALRKCYQILDALPEPA